MFALLCSLHCEIDAVPQHTPCTSSRLSEAAYDTGRQSQLLCKKRFACASGRGLTCADDSGQHPLVTHAHEPSLWLQAAPELNAHACHTV